MVCAVIRSVLVALAAAVIMLSGSGVAQADSVSNGIRYVVLDDTIAGTNYNSLGTWTVDYQRILGGNPDIADRINDSLDAEARGQVAATDHSATNQKPWTFHATGTLSFRPTTISEIFIGEYNTDLPTMPFRSVNTRVFDSRSGIQITWDNLFTNKQAGLERLSQQTKTILPVAYPRSTLGTSNASAVAANEINFKAWLPTAEGIELHFGDFQFGRGLPVITVPWSNVADLIAPQFSSVVD